ncbi:UDP-glucose 6-dehydrogenase YwqF [Leucobacter aridicollis]|uniref:UDP-glucose dehydrogenase family protein n=1 Tax=Leucobacter aridicollis TaxID=283878 RepID=UPI0037C52B03
MTGTTKPLSISVIGCGYLGTVHAVAMAALGHDVIGIDIDAERIAQLAAGQAPFFEPGLPERLEAGLASGRLRFSSDIADAATADLHFVCVGTPQAADGDAADLTAIFAATEALLPHVRAGSVIAGKSTVPVGTAARIAERLEPTGATLVWNPEFLREGRAVADSLSPDRIVIGVAGGEAGHGDREPGAGIGPAANGAAEAAVGMLRSAYARMLELGTPLVVTDLATAELVKGAANAYLATRISFMNAMADVAERAGADISGLAEALGHDERIGPHYLRAGIGFGGGCLPKDIRAFAARATELGAASPAALLATVDSINLGQRSGLVAAIAAHFGGDVAGRRIAVLGAAFKPESDDIRDSPAIDIALELHRRGAVVTLTDPAALPNVASRYPELSLTHGLADTLRDAECVVVATEWPEYREIDPAVAAELVAERTVFDGRNCLDRASWSAAGWLYRGIGRR